MNPAPASSTTSIPSPSPFDDLKEVDAAKDLVKQGNMIGAIKILRNANGLLLREAKDICVTWRVEMERSGGITPMTPTATTIHALREELAATKDRLESVMEYYECKMADHERVSRIEAERDALRNRLRYLHGTSSNLRDYLEAPSSPLMDIPDEIYGPFVEALKQAAP